MTYLNDLKISQSGKGIPYGAHSEPKPDGEMNHGFTNLKGAPEALSQIPELERDPALYRLVKAINQPDTGLLSIGCTSGPVSDDHGHRMSGYVEFAFNSDRLIADAGSYFPVFFHFERALTESRFDQDVHFAWELAGATFLSVGADGFTCTIYLNTGYNPTPADAQKVWEIALDFLGRYLRSVPPGEGQPLC